MWIKIYLGALAVAVIVTGFFTFYSHSWLGSIGKPETVVSSYEYYSNLAWSAIWIFSIILLITANFVLWHTRKIWAMWTTFGFFAVFVLLQTFLLASLFTHYKVSNNLSESSVFFTPFLGIIFCILIAIIVYFNQFLLLRVLEKMRGNAVRAENDLDNADKK